MCFLLKRRVKYRHLIPKHGFICGQAVLFIHLSNLFAFSNSLPVHEKCRAISRNVITSVTHLLTLKPIVDRFHADWQDVTSVKFWLFENQGLNIQKQLTWDVFECVLHVPLVGCTRDNSCSAVGSNHAPLPTVPSWLQNLVRVRWEKWIWQSVASFLPTTTNLPLNFRSELQP